MDRSTGELKCKVCGTLAVQYQFFGIQLCISCKSLLDKDPEECYRRMESVAIEYLKHLRNEMPQSRMPGSR